MKVTQNKFNQFLSLNKNNLDVQMIEGFKVQALEYFKNGKLAASCLYENSGGKIAKSFYLVGSAAR